MTPTSTAKNTKQTPRPFRRLRAAWHALQGRTVLQGQTCITGRIQSSKTIYIGDGAVLIGSDLGPAPAGQRLVSGDGTGRIENSRFHPAR